MLFGKTETFLKKGVQTILSEVLAIDAFLDHVQDGGFDLLRSFLVQLFIFLLELLLILGVSIV